MKTIISLITGTIFFVTYLNASVQYDYIKLLINDRAITNIEIEIKAYEIAQAKRADLTNTDLDQFKKEATDILIEETLLDIRADELQIFLNDDELDDELEGFRTQRKISQVEFEELLEKQNISLMDFRASFLRQIRRNRVIFREIRSKINIDEDKLKMEYEKNLGFEKLVHARHILFRLNNAASEEEAARVYSKATQLKERIVGGEPFEKMADQYSEDPSVNRNHGDLGFFKESDMVKEFSNAAFELEPGQVSDPVRTPFGYHLIEVVDVKKQPKDSFETVKTRLMNLELKKQYDQMYQDYMSNLKTNAKIIFK
ncbi:peptidylprolyl isomerase [bacterium]|nr:peptidylprolyl isomerase [bacterium]